MTMYKKIVSGCLLSLMSFSILPATDGRWNGMDIRALIAGCGAVATLLIGYICKKAYSARQEENSLVSRHAEIMAKKYGMDLSNAKNAVMEQRKIITKALSMKVHKFEAWFEALVKEDKDLLTGQVESRDRLLSYWDLDPITGEKAEILNRYKNKQQG